VQHRPNWDCWDAPGTPRLRVVSAGQGFFGKPGTGSLPEGLPGIPDLSGTGGVQGNVKVDLAGAAAAGWLGATAPGRRAAAPEYRYCHRAYRVVTSRDGMDARSPLSRCGALFIRSMIASWGEITAFHAVISPQLAITASRCLRQARDDGVLPGQHRLYRHYRQRHPKLTDFDVPLGGVPAVPAVPEAS